MKRNGFTLVEAMFVTVIMTMLLTAVASVLTTSISSFNTTSNQYFVDVNVSTALQYLNRDLQEGKQIKVLSPTSIRVYYPVTDEEGAYNRNIVDSDNTVEFYRGDKDGKENAEGRCLVRKPALEPPRVICNDVVELKFVGAGPTSLDVSLRTERKTDTGARKSAMTHRTIHMRNT